MRQAAEKVGEGTENKKMRDVKEMQCVYAAQYANLLYWSTWRPATVHYQKCAVYNQSIRNTVTHNAMCLTLLYDCHI